MQVPLLDAVGCVLAESVVAPEPQPGFAASIMDGYAALASDGPGTYPVVGVIRAGTDPEKEGEGGREGSRLTKWVKGLTEGRAGWLIGWVVHGWQASW